MVCKVCGGQVDDPFWDDICRDCEHDGFHDQGANFEVSCGLCIAEAEDRYDRGERFNGERWVDPLGTAVNEV